MLKVTEKHLGCSSTHKLYILLKILRTFLLKVTEKHSGCSSTHKLYNYILLKILRTFLLVYLLLFELRLISLIILLIFSNRKPFHYSNIPTYTTDEGNLQHAIDSQDSATLNRQRYYQRLQPNPNEGMLVSIKLIHLINIHVRS